MNASTIKLASLIASFANTHRVNSSEVAKLLMDIDTIEEGGEVSIPQVVTPTVTHRPIGMGEVLKSGDEWILKAEFRHNHGKERKYRPISSDSIGKVVSSGNFPKSDFRRAL